MGTVPCYHPSVVLLICCSFYWVSNNCILSQQKGVFRVNCIDCLDRTNVVQVSNSNLQPYFGGENGSSAVSLRTICLK